MSIPTSVSEFLAGRRFAVAGVSRDPHQAANAVFRRLQSLGYEVVPVNPRAAEVEQVTCYPEITSVPGPLDGVVVAGPPGAAIEIVRQCAARGVSRVWFHRSFGAGSVSAEAVRECGAKGIHCIVGGCPLMYCGRVDPAHRCMRGLLRWMGRVPG